jgi:hypothetical protein
MLSNAVLVLAAAMVVGPADKPNLPEEAKKAIGYYVGNWRGEWTENGEMYVNELSVKWVEGKHCTVLTSTTTSPKGVSHGTLLSGWDAVNKEIVDCSFESDGSHSIERWKIVSPTVEEAKSTGVSAQGRPMEAAFRIQKKDKDKFTITVTNRKEGGQSKPDLTVEYVKLLKAKKPEKNK